MPHHASHKVIKMRGGGGFPLWAQKTVPCNVESPSEEVTPSTWCQTNRSLFLTWIAIFWLDYYVKCLGTTFLHHVRSPTPQVPQPGPGEPVALHISVYFPARTQTSTPLVRWWANRVCWSRWHWTASCPRYLSPTAQRTRWWAAGRH